MQLHILKLQTCSLNTLLCIICPSALQNSQCCSYVFSFFLLLKNKQANNKSIYGKLTFQHFFPCFFTVISTNFLTTKPAQNMQWWPAAKLSQSVSPRRAAKRNHPSSHSWQPLYHSCNKQHASHFERKHEKTSYLCYSSAMGLKTSLIDRLLKTFNMKGSWEVSHDIPDCPSTSPPLISLPDMLPKHFWKSHWEHTAN